MANKTLIKGGYVHDGKGKQFTTLDEALANNAKCGCGLDCKNGILVLPNFNPVSGDIDGYYAIQVVDGSISISPVADAITQRQEFCNNVLISATSVVMTGCPEATIDGQDPVQLSVTVLPAGSDQTGTWETSDDSIAEVTGSGLVTPIDVGTVTITFTSNDGGFTASCEITISA